LTQEEIEALTTNRDPQIPSHHQVDPRIIKAYLTGESVPTYLPGHFPSRYFGILPTYLPRDQFLPSELVVPLVDDQYQRDYHTWKYWLDTNKSATEFLVYHFRDPLYQVIEAPVCIPFIPTVRAAELRWWNGYINTYHSFNNLIQFRSVREGSSWEGGGPIQLPHIPQDSTIANNYRQYRDSEGIEKDSMRNPPRPVKRTRLGSFTSNSLFSKVSELSEGSEHTELTLPLLDADRCNEKFVMETFYGNNQTQ
jgi:hypothetical protein